MPDAADKKNPISLIVLLALGAAMLGGALYMMRRADARAHNLDIHAESAPVPVDVYTLRRVDIPRLIHARGFIRGIEEVTVATEVPGRLMSRAVPEGSRVAKGDILLQIDETFHQLAVQQGEAELTRTQAQLSEAIAAVAQATAQVESARVLRDNRHIEFERVKSLSSQGNAPPIEFDRAQAALRGTEADVAAAEAALKRAVSQQATADAAVGVAQANFDQATTRLERCAVRSPIDGRVNRYFVETGEYAVAGGPLVEIVRLDTVKMIVELSGSQVGLLSDFTDATLVSDADGKTYAARLHHVAPKIDQVSRRFQVEFHVTNVDETLLAGMYATLTARCGMIKDVLRVPREALFKHYGADSCLVVEDRDGRDRAVLRRVEVGEVQGRLDELAILGGLQEGERVIVSRRRELHSGVTVQVGKDLAAARTGADPPAGQLLAGPADD